MRLLVVEDEPKTALYLRKGLSERGFVVDVTHDGEEGCRLATEIAYDCMIIDVLLPRRDGWSMLAELRRTGNQVPALVLSALGTVNDRVKALRLGADDYVVKPFAFSELVARIEALLRRAPHRRVEALRVADLEVDVNRHKATRAAVRLDLTPKEFQLLSLLARHPGEVFSRAEIAEQVWDMNFDSDTNVVDVHIRRLRSKVDEPFPHRLIQTVRGRGYVLEERGAGVE